MAYDGRDKIELMIVGMVPTITAYLYRVQWFGILLIAIFSLFIIRKIQSNLLSLHEQVKTNVDAYSQMSQFIVSYRQSRQLLPLLEAFNIDTDTYSFNQIRAQYSHYIWHTIVNLVELDVIQGDPDCVEQLYDLEEELDMWYIALMSHSKDVQSFVHVMLMLVLVSLVIAWFILNLLHSVVMLSQHMVYQVTLSLFIVGIQLLVLKIYKIYQSQLVLEVECVS